jgi:hypothetical protein
MAETLLPAKMGQKYTDIVLLCLQCLDTASVNASASVSQATLSSASTVGGSDGKEKDKEKTAAGEFDDIYDEDGIVVGVKYIEKILLRMQEISI